MTTRTWTWAVFLAVTPAVALAPTSWALATVAPSVAEREARAGALFEEGAHAEAIAIFEALYAEHKSPNYLYNIARIQEDAGELEDALENYEKFVGSPGVELELREAASERVRTIRRIVENTRAGDEEPPQPDSKAGTTVIEDPEPEPSPTPARVEPQRDNPPAPREARTGPSAVGVTGYALLGTGVAALIAAGVVGGLAVQDQDELTADGPVSDSQGLQEAGKRKALAADVLFAIGGVFAASGLTMVIVDAVRGKKSRARASSSNRRLTFGASDRGVMLGLGGRL